MATSGNAVDFGDLLIANYSLGALSNSTRGIWGGGDENGTVSNTMQYVTIASTGNAIDFGDFTQVKYGATGLASPTRGVFGGGITTSNV